MQVEKPEKHAQSRKQSLVVVLFIVGALLIPADVRALPDQNVKLHQFTLGNITASDISGVRTSMNRPLIGAIRWDIFYGGDKTNNPDLKSLSPQKYHNRVPFFLTIESEDTVSGSENNQAIIDKEVDYAKTAGIDYWAFVTPPKIDPNGGESYALDKYLKSSKKSDLKFCVILHQYDKTGWEDRVKKLVEFFKESSYVKVLGHRPLVYIFNIADMEKVYGTETRKNLDLLTSQTAAAGLGKPYYAFMNANADILRRYGADALSSYAIWSGRDTTYAALAESARQQWETYRESGVKLIPLATVGWNQQPRTDNPPPWGGGGGPYFARPTPGEAAAHIRDGLDYVERHPDVCDAGVILCYAWNEFAEGGWLCPTHADGTKHLDAIRRMIERKK